MMIILLASFVAFTLFLAAVAIGLLGEVRQLQAAGHFLTRELELGSLAPPVVGLSLTTNAVIRLLPKSGVVVFLSPNCPTCQAIANSRRALHESALVVCAGGYDACRDLVPLASTLTAVVDSEGVVGRAYGVSKHPTVVVLAKGAVAKYIHPLSVDELVEALGRSDSGLASESMILTPGVIR